MTLTFTTAQAMGLIIMSFIAGLAWGVYFEREHGSTRAEIEALEDEIEELQTDILRSEKDKDSLREIIYDALAHPAVKHLINDRRKARGLKSIR